MTARKRLLHSGNWDRGAGAGKGMLFRVSDILAATGGELISGSPDLAIAGVSTDSRTVAPGELFVPLVGERFDGHDFLAEVSERGVAALLCGRDRLGALSGQVGAVCIAVNDTLRALGDLATWYRNRFQIPVIGVTGSNGKTTTKEMLAAILGMTGRGLKTSGNLNNLIGLPRMLFQLQEQHQWAVLEMGMSEFGEIDRLAEIAGPRIGIITNAVPAHLESLGSVEGVAKAKGELFLRLPVGGVAVFNADDHRIAACPSPDGVARISFGLGKADVTLRELSGLGRRGQSFKLLLGSREIPVTLRALGRHNLYNALAAAAAADQLGVALETIKAGLESFSPYDKRFALEEVGGLVLIDDSYNSNPASVRAALETVRDIREECGAVAVLGDMLELGESTAELHREVGRLAASCIDRLYLLGEMAGQVADGARAEGMAAGSILIAGSHEEILADLLRLAVPGDHILVKGSRGMRMERIAEGIRNAYAVAGSKGVV